MQFSDDFNRADSADIGTNFTPYTGLAARIVGNEVRNSVAGTDGKEFYNGTAPGAEQFAQVTLATFTGTDSEAGVIARASQAAGTQTEYEAYASNRGGGATSEILERVAGAGTLISSENATAWAAGNILRFDCSGSDLRLYRNGALLLTGSDATITTGSIGVYVLSLTTSGNAELDNFIGGDLYEKPAVVLQAMPRGAFY